MESKFPNAKIDFSMSTSLDGDGNQIAVLSRIVIPEDERGRGAGSDFMEELNAWSDETGITVALTPSSDFGGTVSRLKEFYERHGYVKNSGSNKDYSIRDTMYRQSEGEPLPTRTLEQMTSGVFGDFVKGSGGYKETRDYSDAFAEISKARADRRAIGVYLGTNGLDINKSLRGDSGIELSEAQRETIDSLDSSLEENIINVPFDTFRGVSTRSLFGDLEGEELEAAMKDLVGTTLSDGGFMSTSLSAHHAAGFAGRAKVGETAKDRPPVVMRIKVPSGSSGIFIGPGMTPLQEQEVILPRNTNLKVTGVTLVNDVGGKGPRYVLDVEVVT
jgi:hypothetical protein